MNHGALEEFDGLQHSKNNISYGDNDLETDEPPMPINRHKLGLLEHLDSGLGQSVSVSLRSEGEPSLDWGRHQYLSEKGAPISECSSHDRLKNLNSEVYFSHTSDYDSGILPEYLSNLQLNDNHVNTNRYNTEDTGIVVEPNRDRIAPEIEDIYTADDDGDTQLHMSIIQGIDHLTMVFIKSAPEASWLNIQNNLQQAPLHLAVITNRPLIVRRLMVGGADVDPKDNRGNTPLHIACIEGYQDIIGNLVNPIQYQETTQNEYPITYQKIPQDLEAKNYDGLCCLHLAAMKSYLSAIRLLLTKGANINVPDGKSGRTILHYAAETGNRILLKLLLNYPALNLDAETYGGETALVLARGRGYTDIVSILKERGARYDSEEDESEEEEMIDIMYDDFHINGEPVSFT
ncbi:hypothetical protein ScPMuIL_013630 [Solemya velum]